MLSWIQKTFRGYLGVGRDSDMGNRMSWSPWSVRKEHLWSPRKEKTTVGLRSCGLFGVPRR